MSFVKQWSHEIVIGLLALWGAIGTQGQNGILNLATNTISHYKLPAAIIMFASIIIARLRPAPTSN